jgi:hypothetical protein
LLGQP